ncbi:MAG: hypothetical protein ACJ73C_12610 [Nitrososphaeraceae archaeon]
MANSSLDDKEESSSSNVIKKKEKEMSKGLQETYKEDMQGQSYELSKGSESEREKVRRDLVLALNICSIL